MQEARSVEVSSELERLSNFLWASDSDVLVLVRVLTGEETLTYRPSMLLSFNANKTKMVILDQRVVKRLLLFSASFIFITI